MTCFAAGMLQVVRVKHFAVFLMAGVVLSVTLNFDSLCNIRAVNSCRSVTQMYQFGIALPPPPIHALKGNFIYFPKQNPLVGGWSNSAAHKVGLPLWLHLHILQESSTTNEFISYFREPGRSTLPFPPCQPQVWPKRGIQMEFLKKPGYSRVLRAWLNFSPGLTFTTPHTAATAAAAAVRFACQRCGPLLPPSRLSFAILHTDGWMERRGVWEWLMRNCEEEALSAPLPAPQHRAQFSRTSLSAS